MWWSVVKLLVPFIGSSGVVNERGGIGSPARGVLLLLFQNCEEGRRSEGRCAGLLGTRRGGVGGSNLQGTQEGHGTGRRWRTAGLTRQREWPGGPSGPRGHLGQR
jgi:hypothetical protein